MAKTNEDKREMQAKNFMIKEKKEFKKFIPRDTIDDVSVTECTGADGVFEIAGSVGTTSPTGKSKTFRYSATVQVDEKGKCALSNLKVSEL